MYHLARLFRSCGHEVDVVFANTVIDTQVFSLNFFRYILKKEKINLVDLHGMDTRIENGFFAPTTAYLAYLKLRERFYDHVFFNDLGGIGYYCFLAQRDFNAFPKTKLSLIYHGPTKWHLLNNESPVDKYTDIILEATERLGFETAPHLIFATEHAKASAKQIGYNMAAHSTSRVCMFPFDFKPVSKVRSVQHQKKQFVFFGRLEKRKGLITVLDAALKCKEIFRGGFAGLTFLGSTRFVDETKSDEYLMKWSQVNGIPIEVFSQADSESAISFLTSTNSVAILASTAETLGYTLAECIVNDIPYICSDIQPFKSISRFFGKKPTFQFKAKNSEDLARCFKHCLTSWPKRTQSRNFEHLSRLQISQWNQIIQDKQRTPEPASTKKKRMNTIGLAIVAVERDVGTKYFNELVTSIKKLKKPHEIIILANGFSDLNYKKFLKVALKISGVRLLKSKKKMAVSSAKNYLARKLRTDFVFFVDDDNCILAENYNRYSSYFLTSNADILVNNILVTSENELHNQKTYRVFLNNELSINLVNNMAGDGNFIVRRKKFLSVGGFNKDLNFAEDQDLLLRFNAKGFRYQLIPDPLIIYRKHNDSLTFRANQQDRVGNLIKSIATSTHLNPSSELLIHYLDSAFKKDDAINGQSSFLENYYSNALKLSPQTDTVEMLKRHFSNKIVIEGKIPFIKSESNSISNQKASHQLIELRVYSSKSTQLTTSCGESFHLFVGFNQFRCNLSNAQKISLSFDNKKALVAVQSLTYVNS